MAHPRYVREGIIGGLIGATLVAVWFLIYDAARGRPFRTPALLGAATFQGVTDPSGVPVSTHLVVEYTVLHGVVFALIGILIASVIWAAQSKPAMLLTLVIVLLCFEVFFLAVVVSLAHPVLGDVAWWSILVANVLAAAGMLAYFFIGYRALGRVLLGPWTRVFREGFVAGILGAAAVAIWFLIVDTAAGMPLRTPALLGAAMLEGLRDPGALVITWPLVIKYTLIHGGAFALFGWVLAGLLTLADREPRLLYAIIMLFCCFEVFFIAIIAITAEWLFEAVAWWNILAGNVLAALVMLAYFFIGYRALGRVLLGPWTRVFREGFVAGLLGAAAVAIWFLIVDTAAGMPLRTPALLGAAMLEGLRDPGALVITWPLVIKYTLIHGGAFLLFGWLLAGLLTLADREPRLLYAIIMLFCCFEVFFIAIIAITAEWLFEALAWWNILAGNVLAALVMLAYFFRGHRVTWREFITATRES